MRWEVRSVGVQEPPACEPDHGLYFLMIGNFLLHDIWLMSREVSVCVPSPVVIHSLYSQVKSLWSWSQTPKVLKDIKDQWALE